MQMFSLYFLLSWLFRINLTNSKKKILWNPSFETPKVCFATTTFAISQFVVVALKIMDEAGDNSNCWDIDYCFFKKRRVEFLVSAPFLGFLEVFSSQTPLLLDSRRHLKVESKWKLTHDLSLWWKTMPPLFQALTFSSWSHMWQSA